MTIGTSAPPTGSTNSTPAASDATTTITALTVEAVSAPPCTNVTTDSATATTSDPPNSSGWPGSTTGRVVITSCSFRNVTTEPANDTLPTTIVNIDATSANPPPVCASSRNATIAAAPPPTPLNSAT